MVSSLVSRRVSQRSLLTPTLGVVSVLLCAAGCGSADEELAADTPNMMNQGPIEDVGEMSRSPLTCTAPGTICMNLRVPSDMPGAPRSLYFDIYDSAGAPMHLPNGYAGVFTAPEVTAGEQLYFELTDAGMRGDYWMWVIMYMEGGGYGAPVIGTDYTMRSPASPLPLDGTPINITEPVVLER